MYDGEDVNEEGDAVDKGKGTEAWLEGLILLEDDVVKDHVKGTRHEARQHGGHEPGGHWTMKKKNRMISDWRKNNIGSRVGKKT